MSNIELEKLSTAMEEIDSFNDSIECYRNFFDFFGVKLENEDGSYKPLYDIFMEASRSPKADYLRIMFG